MERVESCSELSDNMKKYNNYKKYPISSVLLYDGVTIIHFLLGSFGIIFGYGFTWYGYSLGIGYIIFAFIEMFILMPVMVCPNCVYYSLDDSRCVSGLNILSKRIAKKGQIKDFYKRSQGLFCHNNLYMAGLIAPLVLMLPVLIINFSVSLAIIFLIIVSLFAFRIFIIFMKVACVNCCAKNICQNAKAMGIQDKVADKKIENKSQ